MAQLDAPAYLPEALRERFEAMAEQLSCHGIDREIVAGCLAQYLVSEQQYLRVTNRLTAAMSRGDEDGAAKWGAQQERSFRQCRAAAATLAQFRRDDRIKEICESWLRHLA